MIVIGERINATRKSIAAALEARDADHIRRTALDQAGAGADYLDVNGGDPRAQREIDNIAWLLEIVQDATELPATIDSANPEAVRRGLSMAARKPILNSISLEASRLEPLLEIAADFECMVIALLMGPGGPPCGVDDRLENAAQLVERITAAGKALDEIIIDPCFLPISADPGAGPAVMQAIAAIRKRWPDIHVGGGLSNISYGLPKRRLVNLTALAQAIGRGMDAAILDPCTEGIMGTIYAAEALAGADEMCMGYVLASREGKLH